MAQHQQLQQQHEFLPLCDVLFNIISLASYFCDVVFDLAMGYALANYSSAPSVLFPLTIVLVVTSLLVSQIVSMRWYLWGARGKLTLPVESPTPTKSRFNTWTVWCVIFLHTTQIGVLWRYFKLFIPVDLAYVKHEVRELCVLRLIHAFCEAAPMLLLQLYLLSIGISGNAIKEVKRASEIAEDDKLRELTAVSAGLSLWSVCWAVASFSKGAARLRNLERLVLTWLGVLAQLAWRLGTVSARVGALVAYASLYGGQWLLVVLALHWLSMLTWLLLTPDGLFHGGERLSFGRKTFLASLLAFVYVFAYVNLHETNHRQKMIIFYTVMFLENSLLIGVWVAGVHGQEIQPHHFRPFVMVLILFALFFGGLSFMGLYYRFFHVRRLRYESGGRMNVNSSRQCPNSDISDEKITYDEKLTSLSTRQRKVKLGNNGIPGVFNCRFANPTVVNPNRKKKKPTSFVPPPTTNLNGFNEAKQISMHGNSKQLIPFWKKPIAGDEDTSNGSIGAIGTLNVNLIREKLREKKQQQLRELRAIQEEIKEGKLVPPPSASTSSFSSALSQTKANHPPPNTKLHTSPNQTSVINQVQSDVLLNPWPPVKMHCLLPPVPSSSYHPLMLPGSSWRGSRPETPEILLAPRCLPHHYPHWIASDHRLRSSQNNNEDSSKEPGEGEGELSDMEGSQVSLPRSYTLPREFKYNNVNNFVRERRVNMGKTQSSRFYLPSTNSSDGDVDSADNEDETDSELQGDAKYEQHLNQDDIFQRRFNFVNGGEVGDGTNTNNADTETVKSMEGSLGCYLNNSYGSRVNQLLKAKVKHETKL
ncbi:uncharacterized protein [Chelonus insularis]|uniref:uncharacterized protein n=1 Tax=Chelonus insularis TaxID=460826 RepID=UPI00158F4D1A|nr:uncharacterized protein LOC118071463 [Chelonus insularis]